MNSHNSQENIPSSEINDTGNAPDISALNGNTASKTTFPELIKEQYAQYYEMVRLHTNLSWNIPSLAITFAIVFFGLDSSKMDNWIQYPVVPAVLFFVICILLFVMLIHHIRNALYASRFDQALIELEETWGVKKDVHHQDHYGEEGFWDRITSTKCLACFLIVLIAMSLLASVYFLVLAL